MDDDFVKKRLERDLADLKKMCDVHFKIREDDESHITELETRISDRASSRDKQKQDQMNKEAAKVEQEKKAKEAKEAAEQKKTTRNGSTKS